MTLQNAFKDLATNDTLVLKANEATLLTRASEATLATRASETTVNRLVDSIDALATLMQRQASVQPTRALQYARTGNDQMRVNVDNQAPVVIYNSNTGNVSPNNAGTAPAMWSGQTWNYVDSRQPLAEAQQSNFQMSRNRWIFS